MIRGQTRGIGRPGSRLEDRPIISFEIHREDERLFFRNIRSNRGGVGQNRDSRIALDDLLRCILAAQQGTRTEEEEGYFQSRNLNEVIRGQFNNDQGGNRNPRGFVTAVLMAIGFAEDIGNYRYRFRQE